MEKSTEPSLEHPNNLAETKKQRCQLQQDATLLRNRIKLLQTEETRTWKRIEQTKGRHAKLQQAQARTRKKQQDKQRVQEERDRDLRAAQQNIQQLKCARETGKNRNKETVQRKRQEAFQQGKELRTVSLQRKQQLLTAYMATNRQKSQLIREEERKSNDKLKQQEKQKLTKFKEAYVKRVDAEEGKNKELEQEIIDMERLEMELIKKLQNTQQLQQQVVNDLESALASANAPP